MGARVWPGEIDSVMLPKRTLNQRGAAAVEFALVATVLLLILLGAADFGRAMYARIVIQGMANAGAHYGTRLVGAYTDTAGIQAAAVADAGGLTGYIITSTSTCFCSSGGPCNGVCGGAGETDPMPYRVLTVSVNYTFVPVVTNFPGLPASIPMTASVSMRAQ